MNPTRIDDHWLSGLAWSYPKAAEQIGQLGKHLHDKEERLARLIRFCAAHPELPMMRMYVEYSAALDDMALAPESPDREAVESDVVGIAADLILDDISWEMEQLAEQAGLDLATFRAQFPTRSSVVVAAYDKLLSVN